jgi:hypothetical protein
MASRSSFSFAPGLLALVIAVAAPVAARSPAAPPTSSPTVAPGAPVDQAAATSEDLGTALVHAWLRIRSWTDAVLDAVTDVPTPRQVLECDAKRGVRSLPDAWDQRGRFGTPDAALEDALDDGFLIPVRGYERLAQDADSVLYGFRNGDEVKVAIRVTTTESGEWFPEWLADCQLAEFGRKADMGPGVWLWANRDGRTIGERRGLARCRQQAVRTLWWTTAPGKRRDERLYVRDPEGQFRDRWRAPYLRFTRLPSDARDTGYRRDGATIWMAPDRDSIYIRDGRNVQRWPRIPRNALTCA